MRTAVEETGRLDIVVNNAGILREKVLWRLSDDDWDSVLAVYLGGTFRMTHAAVPQFREQQYGRVENVTSLVNNTGVNPRKAHAAWFAEHSGAIVNVASAAGLRPAQGIGFYGAS